MPPRLTRLLLVDDDPGAIQTLSRMLAQYADQRFATSGAEALRLAREAPPDLILLDADMPGMNGLEVCEALRAETALADIPVIFATSHADPELELAALEKGAVDFVAKPLVAAQVTARVRARLRASLRGGPSGAARPGVNPARFLIVDDDVVALRALRRALADLGEFHFARTGEEALLLARRLAPDLILLDAQLPGMDGFEVCTALKDEAAFSGTPIVFVTRFCDPRTEHHAFELGAADFVAKPYPPAVVRARVRSLIDLKRRTEAERRAAAEHWRHIGEARVADIVDAASDAIVSYDAGGTVVLANAAAARLLRTAHGQLVGNPIARWFGDDLPSQPTLPSSPLRVVLGRDAPGPLTLEVAVSVVGVGDERLTTLLLRDLAERERLERAETARAGRDAARQAQRQMLSVLAHEIGNPLNAMLGFAQLMAADAGHPLPEAQARRLELVLASGQSLKELMRDVADLGAAESGALAVAVQPVAAAGCIAAAMSAASELALRAGVTLSWAPPTPPVQLLADPGRLRQCLANLLTNAIKYNRRGGEVRIEAVAQGSEVAIAVRDNGLGMDAAQLAHLFEPFNRLGRQHSAAAGSGLGLWITRSLVTAMGGRLDVDSRSGQGSCFTIVLPGAPAAADAQVDAARADEAQIRSGATAQPTTRPVP